MLLYDCKHIIGLMMRYSREHKLETHARIVRKASVRLPEKGAHGGGVGDAWQRWQLSLEAGAVAEENERACIGLRPR